MQLSDFDFPFDSSLIANHPVHPRDAARLLIVPRNHGKFAHRHIKDLPEFLAPGDVLVVNNTKVYPARLRGRKVGTGGKVELLLVRPCVNNCWEVLAKGKILSGQWLDFGQNVKALVVERTPKRTMVRFDSFLPVQEILEKLGEIPLPPYIKRQTTEKDRSDYQTIFARHEGAIAAPTAGLHFSVEVLEQLRVRGVRYVSVTLHVGPGTFRPVTTEDISRHRMEAEWYEVSPETASVVNRAKAEGKRVIAVGTTVVRSLESSSGDNGMVIPQRRETQLFITPGFPFRVTDALVTNFHFPRTTLLMLVSAFAGIHQAYNAYRVAVQERYRMYSYGDAMFIH